MGSTTRVCFFNASELAAILRRAVESENGVSVADLTTLGGCAIDFSSDEDGSVEMLVTAWGAHKAGEEPASMTYAYAKTAPGGVRLLALPDDHPMTASLMTIAVTTTEGPVPIRRAGQRLRTGRDIDPGHRIVELM